MRWDWLEELDIDDESEGDGIALISARAPSPPLVQLKGADVGSLPPLRAGSKGQNAEVAQSIATRFSRATSSSSSCQIVEYSPVNTGGSLFGTAS